MLALDRQYGPFAGLVVFGDHADPSLFYYVPEAPTLATRDGAPELSLLEYKTDPTDPGGARGGGFLSFTVELVATPDQIAVATSEIQKLGVASVTLQSVPFRSGTAVLATLLDQAGADGGLRLVERVLGDTTPALYGTQRAMFSLAMATADDVSLVEGMLTHAGVTPVGVRYELRYDGLRPAIQARITAKYDRVYHQLKQQFSAGASYYGIGLSVDLGWATQQLRESGDLEVEVLEFTDDADLRARADEAVRWFQEQLVTRFFEPSMPASDGSDLQQRIMQAAAAMGLSTASAILNNAGAMASLAKQLGLTPGTVSSALGQGGQAGGAGAVSNVSFHLSYTFLDLDETEMKAETIDYSVAAAEERVAAPQGLLGALAPADAAKCIGTVVLGSDDFRNIHVPVQPPSDFAQQGVDTMTVELEYPANRPGGAPPVTSAAFEIDATHTAPQVFAMWVDAAGDLAYRYRVTLAFSVDSPWRGTDPTEQTDWITTVARQLVVSPLEYVGLADLLITPGLLAWTEVSEVQVDVRCGGPTGVTETVLLNQASPNARARFRRPRTGDQSLQARSSWFLASGGRVAGDWANVDSAQLLVDGPFHATRTIRLVPMLPPSFVDCSVTLSYRERGYDHEEVVTFAPGDTRVQTVSIRTFSDPAAPVDLRVYLTRQDLSTLDQTTPAVTAPAFVVADRAGAMRSIRVRLLSPVKFADLKLSAVRVQLLDATDDSKVVDQLLFTESRQDPLTWFIPVASADAPLQYRYRVIRYDLFGAPTASAPVVASDEELILPAMAPPA
jgi:hypothetical protein